MSSFVGEKSGLESATRGLPLATLHWIPHRDAGNAACGVCDGISHSLGCTPDGGREGERADRASRSSSAGRTTFHLPRKSRRASVHRGSGRGGLYEAGRDSGERPSDPPRGPGHLFRASAGESVRPHARTKRGSGRRSWGPHARTKRGSGRAQATIVGERIRWPRPMTCSRARLSWLSRWR
jgi:hypothetical protein